MNFGNGLQISVALPEDDTRSVRALLGVLPLRSVVRRWGDEICFDAPFHSEKEGNGRVDMEVGDVAFWPDGDAIAVFFGPTPLGSGKKPRATARAISSGPYRRLRKSSDQSQRAPLWKFSMREGH